MSARARTPHPDDAKIIAKMEARRAALVEERRLLDVRIDEADEVIALVRRAAVPAYDTVPASEVVEAPKVGDAPAEQPAPAPRPAMRPPSPAFTRRPVGRKPGKQIDLEEAIERAPTKPAPAATGVKARVLDWLARHGEGRAADIAAAIGAHEPTVTTELSDAFAAGLLDKRKLPGGRRVAYALKAKAEAPAAAKPATTPPPKPASAPATTLTDSLKRVRDDVLAQLSTGPKSEADLFRKTAWPVPTLRTVIAMLKAAGKVAGTARIGIVGGEG